MGLELAFIMGTTSSFCVSVDDHAIPHVIVLTCWQASYIRASILSFFELAL